jgi:RNA polymerase sigma-70 factor (ECF subfamily)
MAERRITDAGMRLQFRTTVTCYPRLVRSLVEALRGHLMRPEAVEESGVGEVERLLGDAVQVATEAWPELRLSPDAFVGRLAHHFSGDEPLASWLRRVRAADLFLASACAERVPNAIETLDREHLAAVPAILARGGFGALQADEIRQRVRERLFVGSSKIADYSGRGALASWLQVVTLRIALDVTRQAQVIPLADSVAVEDVRLAGTDPELRLIKERYRGPFKMALRAAITELTSEQRNVLKLHFVDGVTLDKLAALFHVHRATIARRIAQARDTVFDGVRARLQAELGIDRDEFDDLLGLLRSRLELSLSALLPGVS